MICLTSTRIRRVALVIKLSDITTGDTITGGHDIRLLSGEGLFEPIANPDGFFIFTDTCPDNVKITSKAYRSAVIDTKGYTGGVLRFALIPRRIKGCFITVPEDTYTGFYGSGHGYALAASVREGAAEITLKKEDFCDITQLHHAVVTQAGDAEPAYIEKNLGGGRYKLRTPVKGEYQARGTRIIALWRTAGGEIPVPQGTEKVFTMSGGILFEKLTEVR